MVEEFIENFKRINRKALEESFLYGNCYWFAQILIGRFPNALLFYDDIANHFFVKVNKKFYDVSGEIFPSNYIMWDRFKIEEPSIANQIIKNCVWLKG